MRIAKGAASIDAEIEEFCENIDLNDLVAIDINELLFIPSDLNIDDNHQSILMGVDRDYLAVVQLD